MAVISLYAERERSRRRGIAKKLSDGGYDLYEVEAGLYDLAEQECVLCWGDFPKIGYFYLYKNEDADTKYVHWGCFKQAREWAGLPPAAA